MIQFDFQMFLSPHSSGELLTLVRESKENETLILLHTEVSETDELYFICLIDHWAWKEGWGRLTRSFFFLHLSLLIVGKL